MFININLLFSSCIFFLNGFIINAQDILYTKEKDTLLVKILEIDRDKAIVKYQLNSDPYNFTYIIPVGDVKKIVYSEGVTENNWDKVTNGEEFAVRYDSTRHFISGDFVRLIYPAASLGYEYIFGRGKLALKIALTWANPSDRYIHFENSAVIYSYGLGLNYYLKKGNFAPGYVKPFFGLSFEYGAFRYGYQYNSYLYSDQIEHVVPPIFEGDPPSIYYTEEPRFTTTNHSSVGYQYTVIGKCGVLFRPVKQFNISLSLGAGEISFNNNYLSPDFGYQKPDAQNSFGFSVPGFGFGGNKSKDPYRNKMIIAAEINLGYKF
jgi:hypothetical protein